MIRVPKLGLVVGLYGRDTHWVELANDNIIVFAADAQHLEGVTVAVQVSGGQLRGGRN